MSISQVTPKMLALETLFVFSHFTGRSHREVEGVTRATYMVADDCVHVRSEIDGEVFETTVPSSALKDSLDDLSKRYIRPMLSKFNWRDNS